jgi:hypothetical protein
MVRITGLWEEVSEKAKSPESRKNPERFFDIVAPRVG